MGKIKITKENCDPVKEIKTEQIIDLFKNYGYNDEEDIEKLLYDLAHGSGISKAQVRIYSEQHIYYDINLTEEGFQIFNRWSESSGISMGDLKHDNEWNIEYIDECPESVQQTFEDFGVYFDKEL